MLRIGSGHSVRKAVFLKGIRDGHLNVEEVEEALPDGLMTAAERWLMYFSLRAAEVELRDGQGRPLSPDDIVPEQRRRRRAHVLLRQRPDSDIEYGAGVDRGLEDHVP